VIRVVVPLVSEADGDPVPSKRPHFLDKPVVQLLGPLTREESDNFVSSLMNSDRFLQRESIVYARATFAGSRVFQASSARRTFLHRTVACERRERGAARASLLLP